MTSLLIFFIYFGNLQNLSCIFDIIFVVQYVLAFDKSQLKFITLITRAHTQRRNPRSTVQYSFLKYNFWCNFIESVWANGGKVTDDQGKERCAIALG